MQQVEEGHAWAAVVIGENFTVDLFTRIREFIITPNTSVIEGSTIYLHMDVTSEYIEGLTQDSL